MESTVKHRISQKWPVFPTIVSIFSQLLKQINRNQLCCHVVLVSHKNTQRHVKDALREKERQHPSRAHCLNKLSEVYPHWQMQHATSLKTSWLQDFMAVCANILLEKMRKLHRILVKPFEQRGALTKCYNSLNQTHLPCVCLSCLWTLSSRRSFKILIKILQCFVTPNSFIFIQKLS